jgi:hypothetical protein
MTRVAVSATLFIALALVVLFLALPALKELSRVSVPQAAPRPQAQVPPQSQPQAPPQAPPQVRPDIQELPPLSEHALQKHAESTYVHNWLSTHDVSGCKWDCGDRTRYNCQDGFGNWLFAVVEGARTITAFFVDQDYGVGHTRDDPNCSNLFHPAHP